MHRKQLPMFRYWEKLGKTAVASLFTQVFIVRTSTELQLGIVFAAKCIFPQQKILLIKNLLFL